MSKVLTSFFFLCVLCIPTAFAGLTPWQDDIAGMRMLKAEAGEPSGKETEFSKRLRDLLNKKPEKLAKEAVRKGDFRLYSVVHGYNAREKDSKTFGVVCSKEVTTKSLIFGCQAPPPVLYKLIREYNHTMIKQKNYPHKNGCMTDPVADDEIKKYDERQAQLHNEIKEEKGGGKK